MRHKKTTSFISDAFWEQVLPLLPPKVTGIEAEPPVMDDREAMEHIFHVFRSGWQWESLPHRPEAIGQVQECLEKWQRLGLFQRMWNAGLLEYDEMRALVRHEWR